MPSVLLAGELSSAQSFVPLIAFAAGVLTQSVCLALYRNLRIAGRPRGHGERVLDVLGEQSPVGQEVDP